MAVSNPIKLSVQPTKTHSIPPFLSHSVQLLRTWRSHFLRPHSQNIFSSVQIDPNGNVDGLLHNLAFTTNMVVDGVQKDHCIDGLQRPLLPPFGDGKNLICNPVYGAV